MGHRGSLSIWKHARGTRVVRSFALNSFHLGIVKQACTFSFSPKIVINFFCSLFNLVVSFFYLLIRFILLVLINFIQSIITAHHTFLYNYFSVWLNKSELNCTLKCQLHLNTMVRNTAVRWLHSFLLAVESPGFVVKVSNRSPCWSRSYFSPKPKWCL